MNALVYPTVAGTGGLGLQAATAAVSLAMREAVVGLGPGRSSGWPLAASPSTLRWQDAPTYRPSFFAGPILRRLRPGRFILDHDRHVGRWAAAQLNRLQPGRVYAFTQVGLESLEWAKERGVPTVLDNPNGHIRGFARVYRDEWAKWIGGPYHGHPTDALIARVEREYELADRIRVSSIWAKKSMVQHGVPAEKIACCPQPVDQVRFVPRPDRPPPRGPLQIVYVGSLDLRKGFVYLLRAGKLAGANHVRFELVGGTGERGAKSLLARERTGLEVAVNPGDPAPAYHRAELLVLPSLEDGFGFVVAEAMACGLPVVVTDQCGSAEWVKQGVTGWVVPAGDTAALAAVLKQALADRGALATMGMAARRAIEARNSDAAFRLLADWFYLTPCES